MPDPETSGKSIFKKAAGFIKGNKGKKVPKETTPQAPVARHEYGLKVAAEGPNPTIDIVAIHGLNGHREKTWETEKGVNWLKDKDMLLKKIPNSRIFVWGYDANTHSKNYLAQVYLHQHGAELVGQLSDKRHLDGTERRPIIFIGHSLGGIVIKSALIHSARANDEHLALHRSIALSTYGIFFLGTPHSGGKDWGVTLGKVASNIASIFVHTSDRVLRHLEEQSEWLSQQQDDYAPISTHFVTIFGWEALPTPLLNGVTSIVVVPPWSAIGWKHNAETVQMMANHVTMVKFREETDPEYEKIWQKLVLMARNAEEGIKEKWAKEDKAKEQGQPPPPAIIYLVLDEASPFQERFERCSRLPFQPANIAENKPDDRFYFTPSEPDVIYDRASNSFKPRSTFTLVGESPSIEETERMRDDQDALSQAAKQYETRVGDKNIAFCTGIIITAHHDWSDVSKEIEWARKRYKPREGSNLMMLQDSFRNFETMQSKVEGWLALLPPSTCASRLCGGLRMVLAVIWRSGILSTQTHKALNQIPVTISHAYDLTPRYDQSTLAQHGEQLYCAILDTLRHIIRVYSRIVIDEDRVQFEESSLHDLDLMRRCQRLIVLQEEVIADQNVRLEALNYLNSVSDKQCEVISTALKAQLLDTQDGRERSENEQQVVHSARELSVNAELYERLGYASCHGDIEQMTDDLFRLPASGKARVQWLVDNKELRSWMSSPRSDLFLVNGSETQHERISPISLYCSMLSRTLQSQAPRIVLYWYCGLHDHLYSDDGDDDVLKMLRNLTGQLLDQIEADKSPVKSINKVWYADFVPYDKDIVFTLFKKLLMHLLKSAAVFCILDGVSWYDDHDRAPKLTTLVEHLAELVDDAQESNFIFKVLLTSPVPSGIVAGAAIGSLEVLSMPINILVGPERNDFMEAEMIHNLSRRSSISSDATRSIYQDTYEYPQY